MDDLIIEIAKNPNHDSARTMLQRIHHGNRGIAGPEVGGSYDRSR